MLFGLSPEAFVFFHCQTRGQCFLPTAGACCCLSGLPCRERHNYYLLGNSCDPTHSVLPWCWGLSVVYVLNVPEDLGLVCFGLVLRSSCDSVCGNALKRLMLFFFSAVSLKMKASNPVRHEVEIKCKVSRLHPVSLTSC